MDICQFFLDRVRGFLDLKTTSLKISQKILYDMIHLERLLIQIKVLGPNSSGEAVVQNGPFKGMKIPYPMKSGALLPCLMGTYEHELHPYLLAASERPYKHFVNLGCGTGYYAIGMALLMPRIHVDAYDINPEIQEQCSVMAFSNGVSPRVTVHGIFEGADFAKFPAGQTLVFCDIEGAEEDLLDPVKYPALAHLDIIVEMHDSDKPGTSERILKKFEPSHDISLIENKPPVIELPDNLKTLPELDRFLLFYEGRMGPTPWAVMIAKKGTVK